MKEEIIIYSDFIKLDQFLKMVKLVSSGSEAKLIITAGKILVNEEIELRRGRKLVSGDQIKTPARLFIIKKEGPETSCL